MRALKNIRIDAGWPFLLAGISLLGATVLIPASDDLAEAEWQRDRAMAIERQHEQRLARHLTYLDALERQDEAVVRSLAATQLNRVEKGTQVLLVEQADASVFPALEPNPVELPQRREVGSILQRLTANPRTKPILLGLGSLAVLIGLLPPSRS